MMDQLRKVVKEIVKTVVGPIDTHILYSATVVGQPTPTTIDVKLDDGRFGLPGMSHLPLYFGIPGVTADIPSGTKVVVGFLNGSRAKPVCLVGWNSGDPVEVKFKASTLIQLNDTAPLGVARITDPVQAGPFVGTIIGPCSTTVKAGT